MRDLKAVFTDQAPESGPVRDAYEDLRNWAIDEFMPQSGKVVRRKLKQIANSYGVREGEVLHLLSDPPGYEPRKRLLETLYDITMLR